MEATFYLLFVLAVISCVFANEIGRSGNVPHGSMVKLHKSHQSSHIRRVDESISHLYHEIVISLKQNNINELESLLLERSSPKSAKYRQWLSFDDISQYIHNPTASEVVLSWIKSLENVEITWTSPRGEYIRVKAPIETWESALQTQFYLWIDDSVPKEYGERKYIRTTEYFLPTEIAEHISTIFNTVQVPPKYRSKPLIPSKGTGSDLKTVASDAVTVDFLNSYYDITTNEGNSSQSQCVFETSSAYFNTKDLTAFQNQFDLTVQAAVDYNGYSTTYCGTSKNCYEGNLDIQYLMGIAQDTTSIYYYTDNSSGQDDPFLVWILEVASDSNPPLVNSISFAEIEQYVDEGTLSSFNTEAMKLGLMGVTVVASSGDNGAAGEGYVNNKYTCLCQQDSGSDILSYNSSTWSGKGYFPFFPATSPYVTAVGATMGPNEGDDEVVCQSDDGGVITSGGGFSTYFNQGSWQSTAIDNFLSRQSPSTGYNKEGRAYPDISVIGVKYAIFVDGGLQYVYGTSASTPVFAGMVSLLNAARSREGLSSVGFINPTLYAAGDNQYSGSTSYFNDITSGNNKCCSNGYYPSVQSTCCSSGFSAVSGWDPVTGWGSINFTKLASLMEATVPSVRK